jgi:NTE family protein
VVEGPIVLALGGGAAKGLAHIGVLRGLEEDGVGIAGIAGTSMGSIIGALKAQGLDARELEALFRAVDWRRLGRLMATSVSGAAYRRMLRETFGEALIEDLRTPFAAVCCDLDAAAMVSLRKGNLATALCASSAIPGILPPQVVDGRRLVDGAIVAPVPWSAARELADAPVVAVSVVRPPAPDEPAASLVTSLPLAVELPLAVGRLNRWLNRVRVRSSPAELGARASRWETVVRSFHIMQHQLAAADRSTTPVIEPRVGRFGWFDFTRVEEIVAAGYDAYRAWAAERL